MPRPIFLGSRPCEVEILAWNLNNPTIQHGSPLYQHYKVGPTVLCNVYLLIMPSIMAALLCSAVGKRATRARPFFCLTTGML